MSQQMLTNLAIRSEPKKSKNAERVSMVSSSSLQRGGSSQVMVIG